jgi:hypothetical protein
MVSPAPHEFAQAKLVSIFDPLEQLMHELASLYAKQVKHEESQTSAETFKLS